jgi:hypothetical protein
MRSDPVSLCSYFIVADRIKRHFFDVLSEPVEDQERLTPYEVNVDIYMTLWYATLYVVIDAWQKMGKRHKRLSELLTHKDYVALLKGFRDDTFHYQPHDVRKRAIRFLVDREAAGWIREVHAELYKYFRIHAGWYLKLANAGYKT